MLKLSDAVICRLLNHTGEDRGNPFGAKVISISVAVAQSYAQLDLCHGPSYIHKKDGRQSLIDETYSLMKFSGSNVEAYSMARSRLAY
jgi:hypothetical protein